MCRPNISVDALYKVVTFCENEIFIYFFYLSYSNISFAAAAALVSLLCWKGKLKKQIELGKRWLTRSNN